MKPEQIINMESQETAKGTREAMTEIARLSGGKTKKESA